MRRIDERHRISGMDLLRAFCAVAVWVYHIAFRFPVDGSVPWISSGLVLAVSAYGYLGVECFFVISGFVISLSAASRTRSEFVIGRIARLMPAYWLCLAVTVVTLSFAGLWVGWARVLSNVTLVLPIYRRDNIDDVFWSLQVEVVFYAVMALWAVGRRYRSRLETFAWAWLALAVIDLIFRLPARNLTATPFAPFFCVGMALYLIRTGPDVRRYALLVLSCAVSMWAAGHQLSQRSGEPEGSPWIAASIVLCLILAAAGSLRINFASERWHHFSDLAGRLSYPVYLLHAAAGGALLKLAYPSIGWLAAAILAVLIASYLVVRFERVASPWTSAFLKRIWRRVTPDGSTHNPGWQPSDKKG